MAALIDDEKAYSCQLEAQFQSVEQKLKEFVSPSPITYVRASELLDPPIDDEEAVGQVTASALEEAARAVLTLGDGVSAEQLAAHLGITHDAARLRLQRATKEGLITRIASGRHRYKRILARGPQEVELTAESDSEVFGQSPPEQPINGVGNGGH